MNTKYAILGRRSIRSFKPDKIDTALINELLEAGFAAPSACNKRPIDFLVVTNEEILKELQGAGKFTAAVAPLVIIVAGNMKRTLPRSFSEYWIHDAGAATENILIRATSLGLGSLWCGVHLQPKVMASISASLGLEEHIVPFSMIKIGYSDCKTEPHSGVNSECVKYFE